MSTDYKVQYEQVKKMLERYQDEIVPELRELREKLERSAEVVRCRECKYWCGPVFGFRCKWWSNYPGRVAQTLEDDFCSHGKRK